jgi:prepilin-type N-terminal cleavage/methylation domain-containing protein
MRSTILSERGFSLPELLVGMVVMLLVTGASMTTLSNAMRVNDTGSQLADASQNLRTGSNQLIRDIMQAGRIIGPQGVPVPTGAGALPIVRPGPPGSPLTFDLSTTTNLPDISTGNGLGPQINGVATDIVTLLTVDGFMPIVTVDPLQPANGSIAVDGSAVTLPAASAWMAGDANEDTPPIQVGDILMFKNPNGTAVQTVTRRTATQLFFDAGDDFRFNQRTAPQGTIVPLSAGATITTMFRVVMTTYYIDTVTTPGAPRLVRRINLQPPQAIAGVVEDLQLTYDLANGVSNPIGIASLPYTDSAPTPPVTYNSNQIRKVNIQFGVRSEGRPQSLGDYVRSHLSTSVDVRSLASVDNYVVE